MTKHPDNSTIEKIGLPKIRHVHHCETNQHSGIPTQASRFHEDSPHVSCFIVGALPCFYHSKENTQSTSTNYSWWWARIWSWRNLRLITLSFTILSSLARLWHQQTYMGTSWKLIKCHGKNEGFSHVISEQT